MRTRRSAIKKLALDVRHRMAGEARRVCYLNYGEPAQECKVAFGPNRRKPPSVWRFLDVWSKNGGKMGIRGRRGTPPTGGQFTRQARPRAMSAGSLTGVGEAAALRDRTGLRVAYGASWLFATWLHHVGGQPPWSRSRLVLLSPSRQFYSHVPCHVFSVGFYGLPFRINRDRSHRH